MKDKKEKKSCKDNIKNWFKKSILVNSIRDININLLYITLIDIGFFVLFYYISTLFGNVFGLMNFSALDNLNNNPEDIMALKDFNSLMFRMLIYFFIYLITVICIFSLSRYFIYSLIMVNKKFKWKEMIYNFFSHFLYFILFFMILFLISKAVNPNLVGLFGLVVLILFTYVFTFYNILFIKTKKAIFSISEAWNEAFKKKSILSILSSFFIIIIGYSLISVILNLFNFNGFMNQLIYFIQVLVFLIFLAWLRIYISKVVLHK